MGVQAQVHSHDATRVALAEASKEAELVASAQQQAQHAQHELQTLGLQHEQLQAELAVTNGRLSAFDDSCQRSLDRVQTLSAALQEAQHAKVSLGVDIAHGMSLKLAHRN